MKTPLAGNTKTKGSLFRAITWLVLLAFTFQTFVAQIHIHGPLGVTTAVENQTGHKNAPANNDSANCPYCQAIVHAGAFHSPPAPILTQPVLWAEVVAASYLAETVRKVAAHLWQSRAPPRG